MQPGFTTQLLPKKHQQVVKYCASCLKHPALQRNSTLEVNYCIWRRSRMNEWQCGTILSFPLEIVVRILSQTLYRENAECKTSNGITSTSVREARPPSQLCNISKDGPKQLSITLGLSEGVSSERAGAQLPGEWPIYKLNSSQRVAGSARVATVMGKTSTSQFSINSCPARRHTRGPISINPVHASLSTILFTKIVVNKILARTTHATNTGASSIAMSLWDINYQLDM